MDRNAANQLNEPWQVAQVAHETGAPGLCYYEDPELTASALLSQVPSEQT